MAELAFHHLWPVGFALIVWYGGTICAWSLWRTARSGVAGWPAMPEFRRRSEPVEFWSVTAINLLVPPGVVWLAVDSVGVRPDIVWFHLRALWLPSSPEAPLQHPPPLPAGQQLAQRPDHGVARSGLRPSQVSAAAATARAHPSGFSPRTLWSEHIADLVHATAHATIHAIERRLRQKEKAGRGSCRAGPATRSAAHPPVPVPEEPAGVRLHFSKHSQNVP